MAGGLARLLVDQFKPGLVSALERSGVDLVFVTTLQVSSAPGQTALLVPEVNPLLYTYGLAFFLALMLAARAKWWKMAQVGVKLGPEISAQAGLLGWRAEIIALCYQVGNLIFPSLMPVVLWAALSRAYIGMRFTCRPRLNPSSGASAAR